MATLLISLPDGEQVHELTDEITTIGRISDNMIQIDDGSVSSHHAQIKQTGGRFELEDLDSTNGTRVNGQRQQRLMLTDGMKISFGQIATTFKSEASGESLPLPTADEIDVKVADQTRRPAEFVNASPYGHRTGRKDVLSLAVAIFAALAFLAGLAAIYFASTITAPGV